MKLKIIEETLHYLVMVEKIACYVGDSLATGRKAVVRGVELCPYARQQGNDITVGLSRPHFRGTPSIIRRKKNLEMYNWTESNGDYLNNSRKKNLEMYNLTESNGNYLNNPKKNLEMYNWTESIGDYLNNSKKKLGDVQLD
jgi:hypothetical protein